MVGLRELLSVILNGSPVLRCGHDCECVAPSFPMGVVCNDEDLTRWSAEKTDESDGTEHWWRKIVKIE